MDNSWYSSEFVQPEEGYIPIESTRPEAGRAPIPEGGYAVTISPQDQNRPPVYSYGNPGNYIQRQQYGNYPQQPPQFSTLHQQQQLGSQPQHQQSSSYHQPQPFGDYPPRQQSSKHPPRQQSNNYPQPQQSTSTSQAQQFTSNPQAQQSDKLTTLPYYQQFNKTSPELEYLLSLSPYLRTDVDITKRIVDYKPRAPEELPAALLIAMENLEEEIDNFRAALDEVAPADQGPTGEARRRSLLEEWESQWAEYKTFIVQINRLVEQYKAKISENNRTGQVNFWSLDNEARNILHRAASSVKLHIEMRTDDLKMGKSVGADAGGLAKLAGKKGKYWDP